MLKIYLARHGQNEDNAEGILNGHRDRPLTEQGLRQAHQLADGIVREGYTFDAVYSSPLSRAHTTAQVVCERLELPVPVVVDLLIERDFGVMTGRPASDIERLCAPEVVKTDTITYFLSPEGAETFPMLLERAHDALSNTVERAPQEGSVLLVTHGDFGKMLYASYYGISWPAMLTLFHFGNCELLLLAPDADPRKPHVINIEQHNH
ncbi:MAG: histidine phosphatase family protein [Patescibacteria group bacterium]